MTKLLPLAFEIDPALFAGLIAGVITATGGVAVAFFKVVLPRLKPDDGKPKVHCPLNSKDVTIHGILTDVPPSLLQRMERAEADISEIRRQMLDAVNKSADRYASIHQTMGEIRAEISQAFHAFRGERP